MAVWKSDRRGRDSDGPEPEPGESPEVVTVRVQHRPPRARTSGGLLCSESLTARAGAGEVRSTDSGPPSQGWPFSVHSCPADGPVTLSLAGSAAPLSGTPL